MEGIIDDLTMDGQLGVNLTVKWDVMLRKSETKLRRLNVDRDLSNAYDGIFTRMEY